MKLFFPVIFATVYGLITRLLFGMFGNIMGIMSASFFVICPLVIGFLTVIVLSRKKRLSNAASFFLPWLSCLALLIVTIALNVEGTICWIMAFPLFGIVAGFGGVMANSIRKRKDLDMDDVENYKKWTDKDKLSVSLVMLLPFICTLIEGDRLTSRQDIILTQSVVIAATPTVVWNAIGSTKDVSEKHAGFSGMLGFPHYVKTTQDNFALGGKRKAIYERGLYFDETISGYEKEKSLVLNIKTDPYHIPPTVMDEHILIGGKHLDILQDVYRLESLPGGKCRLSISSHFFINTPFNWYAGMWARMLMKDILNGTLDMVKSRVEQK
ncbi:MAG: SRPBCC family protein [Ferruginibacter sp.]